MVIVSPETYIHMATKVTKVSVTCKDVPANELIKAFAAHLKREGKFEVPKWVDIVKTSNAHELGPYNADWFYIRAGMLSFPLIPFLCFSTFIILCYYSLSLSFALSLSLHSLSSYCLSLASILRRLYIRDYGVGGLSVCYGRKSNPGSSTGHHVDGNKNIIRKAMQALEKLQFVEKPKNGGYVLVLSFSSFLFM